MSSKGNAGEGAAGEFMKRTCVREKEENSCKDAIVLHDVP